MKVFLSWSGEHAKAVAQILKDWLPTVIQATEPYISTAIEKGARWSADIARELEATRIGIVCVTPSNAQAPWLHFEAGALAKQVEAGRVIPFLVGLSNAQLEGPLAQFQTVQSSDREDVRRMMDTLNGALKPPLERDRLDTSFDKWWPDLEQALGSIDLSSKPAPDVTRSVEDIVAEILEVVRGQQQLLAMLASPQSGVTFESRWPLEASSPLRVSRNALRDYAEAIAASPSPGMRDVAEFNALLAILRMEEENMTPAYRAAIRAATRQFLQEAEKRAAELRAPDDDEPSPGPDDDEPPEPVGTPR